MASLWLTEENQISSKNIIGNKQELSPLALKLVEGIKTCFSFEIYHQGNLVPQAKVKRMPPEQDNEHTPAS